MRIVFLATTIQLGDSTGDAIHVEEEVRILLSRGHEIGLIAGSAKALGWQHPGLTILTTKFRRSRNPVLDSIRYAICTVRALLATLHFARRRRPDVIYQRHLLLDLGQIISRILRVPLVTELNGLTYVEQLWLNPSANRYTNLLRMIECRSLQDHAGYVCVTEELAEIVKALQSPKKMSPVLVTGNGVDTRLFAPGHLAPTRLGLPRGKYVVFVGYLVKWQSLSWLIDAMCLVVQSNATARLLIVGDGPERTALESKIEEVGLRDHVFFVGRVSHSEIPKYLQIAGVCVALRDTSLPSVQGSAPIKVYEYFAAGKPVIVTDSGELSETVRQECVGEVVPFGDTKSLSAAILKTLEDDNLARGMGARARNWVVKNHSWEVIVDRIEGLLFEAVDRYSAKETLAAPSREARM